MKRFIFVWAIVVFFVSSTFYAQSQNLSNEEKTDHPVKKKNIWYGPKAGLDLATPTIDKNDIKTQLKSNNQIGFFVQFGKKIYLQPEIYYATAKETRHFLTGASHEEVTVNSLKVPVLLGIKLIDLGIVSVHAMAGPMCTFFLSESKTDPEITHPKSFYTLQMGGGVDLFGFVTLDARYSIGLEDHVKEQINDLTWESGINVTLGLKFK